MIKTFNSKTPDTEKACFIAENAVIAGDVTLGEDSSVWFGAVMRGDDESITVGRNSNIQDNCTVHCTKSYPVKIGENVTVGHNAVIHGCEIGDGSLIGMSATVMNGAVLGKNCLVGAGALVTENKVFPDNSLIMGVPAKAVGLLSDDDAENMLKNAAHYVEKAKKYSDG